jgi:hypothetical protein
MKRQFYVADPPCFQSPFPLFQALNLLDPQLAGEVSITVKTPRQKHLYKIFTGNIKLYDFTKRICTRPKST